MNVENMIKLAETICLNDEYIFYMPSIVLRGIDRSLVDEGSYTELKTSCGTACCIAGFAQVASGVANHDLIDGSRTATAWLGLSEEQADKLFYPDSEPTRRRRGITVESDIWGDEHSPIDLEGRSGRLKAINAIKRAIELWGSKE